MNSLSYFWYIKFHLNQFLICEEKGWVTGQVDKPTNTQQTKEQIIFSKYFQFYLFFLYFVVFPKQKCKKFVSLFWKGFTIERGSHGTLIFCELRMMFIAPWTCSYNHPHQPIQDYYVVHEFYGKDLWVLILYLSIWIDIKLYGTLLVVQLITLTS